MEWHRSLRSLLISFFNSCLLVTLKIHEDTRVIVFGKLRVCAKWTIDQSVNSSIDFVQWKKLFDWKHSIIGWFAFSCFEIFLQPSSLRMNIFELIYFALSCTVKNNDREGNLFTENCSAVFHKSLLFYLKYVHFLTVLLSRLH